MMKRIMLVLMAAVAVMAACGCNAGSFGEKISEGVITYHLEYPDDKNSSSLLMMLPPQMILAFKDNNSAMVINGFAGCFSMRNIAKYEDKRNYTMLSIGFNKKYVTVSDFGDNPFASSRMTDMKVTQTDDTMSICGYLCHKIIAHSDRYNKDFSFWFTQDIDLDCAGAITPFKSVNGVMMEFDVELCGIYLKAKAVQVTQQNVADDIFEIPSDYIEISRGQLESVIHSFNAPHISTSR